MPPFVYIVIGENISMENLRDKLIRQADSQNITETEMLENMKSNFRPVREMMTIYTCAMMEIETKLKVLDAEYSLDHNHNPIESIKTRLKSMDSIIQKATKKNIQPNIEAVEENINDIAGVRVICSYIEDIYQISKCLLNQDDIRIVEIKDYIKNPKPNGYRSLHLIVEVPVFLHDRKKWTKVEVQLRTIAMDFWASLEHKAHYKRNIPEDIEKEISADLKYCAEVSAKLDIRMEEIKKKIFSFE